jgi:hypothetical protein
MQLDRGSLRDAHLLLLLLDISPDVFLDLREKPVHVVDEGCLVTLAMDIFVIDDVLALFKLRLAF